MKIGALSDPHFGFGCDKPMDIFGDGWADYVTKLTQNWNACVSAGDVVLVLGDISWALKLSDAIVDLNYLGSLPGKKIIIKGNHELWWQSISKVREVLPPSVIALQNDSVKIGNVIICGTRGWASKEVGKPYTEEDKKIFDREVIRLRLTLEDCQKKRVDGDRVIVMFHFPPFNSRREGSAFTDLFEEFKVDAVVYGHLHGKDGRGDKVFVKNGIKYYLTSTDQVGHAPVLIYDDVK